MCSLLGYVDNERNEVIKSIETVSPFLCALGTYEYFF